MGVDFSHGDAHWGYIGFGLFRKELARHEGFELGTMNGFAEPAIHMAGRPWSEVTTPLEPLLNHPDDDGYLTPEQCRQVALRLREIIPVIWSDPAHRHHGRGMCLAEGMEMAADAGELFEFL